jgi:hypothetical protein
MASILLGDGTTGIVVNIAAGDPKDPLRTVRLRNIDSSGVNIGSTGINILSAAAVIVEDCAISGMVKSGISDTRSEGSTLLALKNTIIANNPGVGINAAAQMNTLVLDHVQLMKNNVGLSLAKTNTASIARSVFSNSATGISADSGGQMMLDSSQVSFNSTGILANGGAVGLTNSDVAFNTTAISGATTSFGNNRIYANGSPGTAPAAAGAPSTDIGQQ